MHLGHSIMSVTSAEQAYLLMPVAWYILGKCIVIRKARRNIANHLGLVELGRSVLFRLWCSCLYLPGGTSTYRGTFTFLSEASNGLPILNLGKAKFEELQVPPLVWGWYVICLESTKTVWGFVKSCKSKWPCNT